MLLLLLLCSLNALLILHNGDLLVNENTEFHYIHSTRLLTAHDSLCSLFYVRFSLFPISSQFFLFSSLSIQTFRFLLMNDRQFPPLNIPCSPWQFQVMKWCFVWIWIVRLFCIVLPSNKNTQFSSSRFIPHSHTAKNREKKFFHYS